MSAPGEKPLTSRPVILVPLVASLVFALYLAFLVFRHFVLVFTVAAAVALLLNPLQRALSRLVGGRSSLASALVVLACTALILVPVLSLAALLGNQAGAFFEWLKPHLQPAALERLWQETLPERFPGVAAWLPSEERLTPLVSDALSRLAATANALIQRTVAGLTTALFEVALFLLILFFLLRDGARLRAELRRISPLSDRQEDEIFNHLGRTVKGVLQAMALVPVAQGILATIGFWIFGVPSAVLWGVMVVLAALVPILGSPLGWVPACAYLFATGATWKAAGLLVYGLLFISTIDNFVKPLLLREAAQIHPLLGFLAILGGLFSFGPLGFLVGPVILSLLLSALRIYRLDILRAH
ncbi:MAG: AI-2E family transporter [Acidobacteria bacterium]|nr:AI-2E family transporter [Acidobacteriota bacterium]